MGGRRVRFFSLVFVVFSLLWPEGQGLVTPRLGSSLASLVEWTVFLVFEGLAV